MNITEQATIEIEHWKDDQYEVWFNQDGKQSYVMAEVSSRVRRFRDGNGFTSWDDAEVEELNIKLLHDYAVVDNEEVGILPITASGLKHLKKQFENYLEESFL